MKGKVSTTSIVHDSEYGDYLSVFVPIKNGNEVIGILGVDIDASKVDVRPARFWVASFP
jgi:methyl-accepting chemotaxis protein